MTPKKIIVFSGPSGAGKGLAGSYALKLYEHQLMFSVSEASRERRPNEIDGVHYHFTPGATSAERVARFRASIASGKFLEWQQVYDNDDGFRGTPASEISRIWERGKNPLLDIDVFGANNVKTLHPNETIRILLKPFSWDVWYQKLCARHVKDGGKLDDPRFLARVEKAPSEVALAEASGFEHVIVNQYDDLFYNLVDNKLHEILGVPIAF